MPLSPRHKEQKGKNLTFFAILLVFIVLLFVITLVKISGI